VVEGAKLVAEAQAAGVDIEAVFLDIASARATDRGLALSCASAGARVLELQPGVLGRACQTVTSQPVAAIVGTIDVTLAELRDRHPNLVVVCADLGDPGNLGTIIRSSAAAGAGAVICSDGSVDLYNPKAVRASAGALFQVPVVVGGDLTTVLDELAGWGLRRWGTAPRHGRDYSDVDLTGPSALVLGNEARGLDGEVGAHVDGTLTIPIADRADSLNVATTAAVLCFEAARQRRRASGRTPSP
jgi:TrmH family RNA methyltransferase